MKSSNPTLKVLRIVLGLFLILYALNKFFQFVPTSYGSMPEDAQMFFDSVVVYLPALYIFEIIIGLMLLTNTWTSFLYVVLFPLSASFMMFSIINQDLGEMWPAVLVAALNIILLFSRKEDYRPLFT
jgi:uncharacterized membrane protein YphA (DoxX/SURF4 family)